MSKLEELIQELCPNGVEYKPLNIATIMKRGTCAMSLIYLSLN